MTFETKAVTHGKYNNDKCQKNLHILKLIIEAVMLFRNKGLHSEATENNQITAKAITNRGNFIAIINAFAKLDTI